MAARSFHRSLMSASDGRAEDAQDRKADAPFALGSGVGGRGARPSPTLSGRLFERIGRRPRGSGSGGEARRAAPDSYTVDPRQRAIVKLHYFNHAGGGAAALAAHGDYIDRERAELSPEASPEADPQASYLTRDDRLGFYDAGADGVDGRARLKHWARADPRHFRIILAPENGEALAAMGGGDLKAYVRETMVRAEAAIGRKLEWVAVDHFDTDNPHAHIVLRARDGDGRVLGLSRDFVGRALREIARDIATVRLGPRGPDDERRALVREVAATRVTRLDGMIAERLDGGGRAVSPRSATA